MTFDTKDIIFPFIRKKSRQLHTLFTAIHQPSVKLIKERRKEDRTDEQEHDMLDYEH